MIIWTMQIKSGKSLRLNFYVGLHLATKNSRHSEMFGRLIADVLQTTDTLKLNDMLITVDIQKAFDSVNHQILILP